MNLKQLAQHLGVSQTTVSRALNGYPEVSEATRKRVVEAASAMNYAPNARAKGLATGRAMAIGHVIPISTQHEMVNPVFGDFVAGASQAYLAAGYDMTLSLTGDADEADNYRRLKAKGNVDGIILHGPKMRDSRIPFLKGLNMPFVVHGRASELSESYNWVDMNNANAFQRATDMLLDLGHRRISLINGLEEMDFAFRRRGGYEAALIARGIAPDPAIMRSQEMTETNGFAAAAALLAQDDPPTAILVSSLITAIGVRRAIHAAGLEMGRDVSVVSHDDDLNYLRNGPDIAIFTATRSSVRDAGKIAAEMLLRHIADPELAPEQRLLEAELIIGASTGPAPGTQSATSGTGAQSATIGTAAQSVSVGEAAQSATGQTGQNAAREAAAALGHVAPIRTDQAGGSLASAAPKPIRVETASRAGLDPAYPKTVTVGPVTD